MFKNIAGQRIAVYAWDNATGSPKIGDAANITATISKDGGSVVALTDTHPIEVDSTQMPGVYEFDMTQDETNADFIIVYAVSATGDVFIYPEVFYPSLENEIVTDTTEDLTVIKRLLKVIMGLM